MLILLKLKHSEQQIHLAKTIILIWEFYQFISMFIKEAYQRRIQEQIKNHSPSYLRIKEKSPAIGSAKVGRVNFANKQSFFNQNDIPLKSKTLKIQTKTFKDPDILELKKQRWNLSVESPKGFDKFSESHKDVLFKIKHGFYDYMDPIKERPKKIYQGVDTRDSYEGWNVSTFLEKNQKQQNNHSMLMSSLQNSITFNKSNLKDYVKPLDRYNNQRSAQKQISINESGLFKTLKQQYGNSCPTASPEKTNATIFKLLEQTRRQKLKETMFVNHDDIELTKKFKANLSDSQRINISVRYFHNGSWSQVPWAQNGYAWSCCMNQEQNGRGCVKKVIDNNKSCFASFNND